MDLITAVTELFKDLIITIGVLVILALVSARLINDFSYLDIEGLCYIGVDEDILRGNDKTINQALSYIKKDSPSDYETVCKYVDSIIETYCIGSDPHIKELKGADAPGCYIKGSKVIYIFPQEGDSEKIVEERAKNIIKYANYSRQFWESRY
jgi:hypothetical protein